MRRMKRRAQVKATCFRARLDQIINMKRAGPAHREDRLGLDRLRGRTAQERSKPRVAVLLRRHEVSDQGRSLSPVVEVELI